MKLFYNLIPILLITLLVTGCSFIRDKIPGMQGTGGSYDYSNPKAPKTIKSKDIESFEYSFATYGINENQDRNIPYERCSFSLEVDEEGVLCKGWGGGYRGGNFKFEFITDSSALQDLQAIIDKRETKERVTAFASLAPNSLTHPPVSDVYTPVEEEEKAPPVPAPPPAAAPPDPGLYSSPTAKTPEALFDAVVEFYKNNPEMWRAGILEMGKGQRYSKEKQVEIVRDWCCYMIQKNQGGNTYVQLNASLQSWFRNEQFATWKNKPVQAPAGSAAPTDAVYTPPPPNTITPAFVK